ncbi:hypothetical protein E2C01_102802 [Portunus trituberculatus]|uniref:Uncharacterized protein n=1 Tax=Portunus trituberculatus TaxID=210409 RepID=A0A5B7KE64_PORTR|nr:hypothetical protein [Portunus trituberculatus]
MKVKKKNNVGDGMRCEVIRRSAWWREHVKMLHSIMKEPLGN